jgi:hypothetical protein
MPYSEVIHPSPWPLRKGGTRSSTLTVQITRVSPTSISADPSACLLYLRLDGDGPDLVGAAAVAPHGPPFALQQRGIDLELEIPDAEAQDAPARADAVAVCGRGVKE